MCGLLGAVDFRGRFEAADFDRFVELTDMVTHRGPDASGYLTFSGTEKNAEPGRPFSAYLGHRRLSIIDLSAAADQPLSDEAEDLWIIYNGEIFNHVELREELRGLGHRFRTESDTEVILEAYREWGPPGFSRLNGMWAFGILDLRRGRLVLSRDRFSIKPLYYARLGSRLFFASEIKQLLPLLPHLGLNRRVMFKHLEQGIRDDTDETFFSDVFKVSPKQNLVFSLETGEESRETYWDYSEGNVIGNGRGPLEEERAAVEEFRALLADAVRIRLRSDVPVGVLLSGGLDSSTISVLASETLPGLETYSVVSEDRRYSEDEFIDIAVRERGLKNHKFLLQLDNPAEFTQWICRFLYHHDEPAGGLTSVAHFMMLEEVRRKSDVIVLLSGQGGDETLMGYLKYFLFYSRELMRTRRYARLLKEIGASLLRRTMVMQFDAGAARRYMPLLHRRARKRYLIHHESMEPVWECGRLRDRQILDLDRFTVPSLTHYEDRTSMAYGLEIRLPFLDHRLVDFLVNLPTSLKIQGGWNKYVLRASMDELPSAIRWRRDKQGFLIPEATWLRNELSKLIAMLFEQSLLEKMGVLNGARFLEYYDAFRRGDRYIWYTNITRALLAELWARQHWNGFGTGRAAA